LQFNPQAGHRPALVVSPAAYNGRTGLALCCPVTSQVKGYPFEVQGNRMKFHIVRKISMLQFRIASARVCNKLHLQGKIFSCDCPALRCASATTLSWPELGRRFGESGAEFVAQRFDRETLARDYLSILRQVASTSC
jgi:mRNA-degrading endonuclease toxin of MazEF toxin-antitoxin module